jgi:hypothetical protein
MIDEDVFGLEIDDDVEQVSSRDMLSLRLIILLQLNKLALTHFLRFQVDPTNQAQHHR